MKNILVFLVAGMLMLSSANGDNGSSATNVADTGDALAMFNIGSKYYSGDGVDQDYAKAMEWYLKAAEVGSVLAIYNIGVMYRDGEGVPKDYDMAMNWFRKAADLGYADAMNNIGAMYANGQGVEKNADEAMKWYRKAADAGSVTAKKNIRKTWSNRLLWLGFPFAGKVVVVFAGMTGAFLYIAAVLIVLTMRTIDHFRQASFLRMLVFVQSTGDYVAILRMYVFFLA